MDALFNLVSTSLSQVWLTFTHNWPFLVISTVVAVLLKLYLDPIKVSAFLQRYKSAGVIGATAVAVTTPLCSCGTTAIILGMMASMMPWAPIVAFMVASPLTSPEELIYSAGLFGWPFAITFFVASILLGLLGGAAAAIIERRGWLKNQTRFASPAPAAAACSCSEETGTRIWAYDTPGALIDGAYGGNAPQDDCGCDAAPQDCGCGPSPVPSAYEPAPASCACGVAPAPCACEAAPASCTCETASADSSPRQKAAASKGTILKEVGTTGWRLLLMFLGFAFIGYFLNGLIPAGWVAAIFGQGNSYSVPLAATLGLPLYINTEASLPLIRAMIDGGMSQGAALAFLITGAGTSIGAITGALTIARWRVIALVIGTLWVGAIATGFLYDLLVVVR